MVQNFSVIRQFQYGITTMSASYTIN